MKAVLLLTALAYVEAKKKKPAYDYHYVAQGWWGKWKKNKECDVGYAICGVKERIEKHRGSSRDDTAGNAIKFMCCNTQKDQWATDQQVIKLNNGHWGKWTEWKMCATNTFMVGMDAKMDPKSAADDTSLGGVRIICDSLGDAHNLNVQTIDSKWGDWVNGGDTDLATVRGKVAFCGGSVRFEGKQGYLGDDTALNGIRLHVCHNLIRSLTGAWIHVGTSPHGIPALSYDMEEKVQTVNSETTSYTKVKEWKLTQQANLKFKIYQQATTLQYRYERETTDAFMTETLNYKKKNLKVHCKEYDGTVNMFQWKWVTMDTAGVTYEHSTDHYICTYGLHEQPQCPRPLCLDEECQYCEGYTRPDEIIASADEDSVTTALWESMGMEETTYEGEEEELYFEIEPEYDEDFFTGTYDATKEAMLGIYSSMEGLFGTATVDEDLNE